mmetsp:Transcript_111704/g.256060  ORF Transcript_111704/g.256060 Transcript_111704/m.256060 type:complete len:216 (-) Transcript_111704:21-668(-)
MQHRHHIPRLHHVLHGPLTAVLHRVLRPSLRHGLQNRGLVRGATARQSSPELLESHGTRISSCPMKNFVNHILSQGDIHGPQRTPELGEIQVQTPPRLHGFPLAPELSRPSWAGGLQLGIKHGHHLFGGNTSQIQLSRLPELSLRSRTQHTTRRGHRGSACSSGGRYHQMGGAPHHFVLMPAGCRSVQPLLSCSKLARLGPSRPPTHGRKPPKQT